MNRVHFHREIIFLFSLRNLRSHPGLPYTRNFVDPRLALISLLRSLMLEHRVRSHQGDLVSIGLEHWNKCSISINVDMGGREVSWQRKRFFFNNKRFFFARLIKEISQFLVLFHIWCHLSNLILENFKKLRWMKFFFAICILVKILLKNKVVAKPIRDIQYQPWIAHFPHLSRF